MHIDPEERQRGVDRAFGMAEEGDWDGAAESLRALLESDEEDVTVLCALGVVETALGLEGVGYERFKRALEVGIDDPELLATAGVGLARFDDPDAEAALRTATLLGPGLARPHYLYGGYLAREGYGAEALRELDEAIQIAPDEPLAFLERGVGRALTADAQGALDDFHQASALDPDDPWARVLVGLALIEADRADEAVADLVVAARLDPEDVEAQMLAALACAAEGDEDLAWEMLERARAVELEEGESAVEELEDLLGEGAVAAAAALKGSYGPRAYHARLMTRP
ncbi:MAG: tetratricopeptide repeat protein [Gemmatimonadota bacterium]